MDAGRGRIAGRRSRRARRAGARVLCLLLLVAGACGGGGSKEERPGPASTVRPSSTAKIAIVSPKNGDEIAGSTAVLRFTLDGGRIVEGTSKDLKPDEGHVHVKLDGVTVTQSAGTTMPLENLKPGRHIAEVEFVAADHFPFDPRVAATVVFRVR